MAKEELAMAEKHAPPVHATHTATVLDPVCGMTVDATANKPTHTHHGQAFHFCSQKCHDKFIMDPEYYLSGAHQKHKESAPPGTPHSCLMHPEIKQEGPGSCRAL